MVKRKVQFLKVKDHLFYIENVHGYPFISKIIKIMVSLRKINFFTKRCGPFLIIETGPQFRLVILLKKYRVITYKASINTSQNIVTQRVKRYLLYSIVSLILRQLSESQREVTCISRQNSNEYIGTLHLAPTQFCLLPGSHCKT